MKVYVTQAPGSDGAPVMDVYSEAAALRVARAAWPHGVKDPRTDEEALDDFSVVHWAWVCGVIE